MNETIKTILSRRASRSYSDEVVSDELLKQIVEAGTWAPTGMNKQSPIILVIKDKELRDKYMRLNAGVMGSDSDPFYGAPIVIVVLADKNVSTRVYDGSCVMENMMLAAESLGVQTAWIHRAKEVFDSEEGKAILKQAGVEGDYEGIGNMIVGYAKEKPEPKSRKENWVYWL